VSGLDTRALNLPGLFIKGSFTVFTLTFIYIASGLCAASGWPGRSPALTTPCRNVVPIACRVLWPTRN